MSRPEFLADHDLNEHIVDGVLRREPSIRLIRVREVGLDERPDPEILEYAAREGLIVVSHDVNTMPAPAFTRVEEGLPMTSIPHKITLVFSFQVLRNRFEIRE